MESASSASSASKKLFQDEKALSFVHFLLYPIEAAGFDFLSQAGTTGLHNAAIQEDVYNVGLQVVQQALVVGDDHGACLRRTQFVEAFGYDTESIHIET